MPATEITAATQETAIAAMPVAEEASCPSAPFAPFSSLSGQRADIRETARLTDRRMDLDESELELLSEKLMLLQERLDDRPSAEFTWFVPDPRKQGGSYMTCSGRVKKILPSENVIVMEEGQRIPMDEVVHIQIT